MNNIMSKVEKKRENVLMLIFLGKSGVNSKKEGGKSLPNGPLVVILIALCRLIMIPEN
jgi:hypothetical protein